MKYMEKGDRLNNYFKNRRRFRRFTVDKLGILINVQTSEASPADDSYKVKMLNLGGVLIEGVRMWETESNLLIEMTLPDNVRLSLTGTVTACGPAKDSSEGHYDVGIKFTDMPARERAKLLTFIQRLHLKDSELIR